MPVIKTSRRYMARCDVADCDWDYGPHGLRIEVSQRLRHHMMSVHGLEPVDDFTPRRTMKHASTDLPEDQGLDTLSSMNGKLIAVAAGWTHNDAYQTRFGLRECVEADVFVYDGKTWRNLADKGEGVVESRTPIFFKTVIKQLLDAGPDDDFGGVLSQNVPGRKNNREWMILPANDAAAKALDKFDAKKLPTFSF